MTDGQHPTIALFPGSFDPITNGHLDIISRGARLFDQVVVAILVNIEKSPLFTVPERVALLREVLAELPNVSVDTFDGLLVDYARRRRATAVVRGLRAISDFEYEMEMNQLNRLQAPEIESLYLMASPQYSFLSSSGIKELAVFGGDIDEHVTPLVARRLKEELAR